MSDPEAESTDAIAKQQPQPPQVVNNAFSVLMDPRSRKRPRGSSTSSKSKTTPRSHQYSLRDSTRRGGSRFVLCPVGCGHHYAEKDINQHIDKCLEIAALQQQQQKAAEQKAIVVLVNENSAESEPPCSVEVGNDEERRERSMPESQDGADRDTAESQEIKEHAVPESQSEREHAVLESQQGREHAIPESPDCREHAILETPDCTDHAMPEILEGGQQGTPEISEGGQQAAPEISEGLQQATPESLEGREHAIMESPDCKEHAVPKSPEDREHAILESPDCRDHAIPESSEGGQHAIPECPDGREHALLEDPDGREHAMLEDLDGGENAILGEKDGREDAIPESPKGREHAIPDSLEGGHHAIPPSPEGGQHAILEDKDGREDAIPKSPNGREHVIRDSFEGGHHAVPGSPEGGQHAMLKDLDGRADALPETAEEGQHDIPVSSDVGQHSIPEISEGGECAMTADSSKDGQNSIPESILQTPPRNHAITTATNAISTFVIVTQEKPPSERGKLEYEAKSLSQDIVTDEIMDTPRKDYQDDKEPYSGEVSSDATKDVEQSIPAGTATNDVFARMMAQSRTVFSSPQKKTFHQSFHLHEDGSVSLYWDQKQIQSPVAWSATLNVKDKGSNGDVASSKTSALFEVTISSSISSCDPIGIATSMTQSQQQQQQNNIRLVRRHSRLTVPVLKSILQKSIRRRRPLPAVRVAMELADKSLGDLLRRLPIIVLEDSTLHPDFPLLVWLMVAQSKNFYIPVRLLTRVMEIVYEIAACQYSDPSSPEEAISTLPPCTLSRLIESMMTTKSQQQPQLPSAQAMMLWSMLIRAEYGGMRCDVAMLRKYATLWMHRFTRPDLVSLPQSALGSSRVTPHEAKDLSWSTLPHYLHPNDTAWHDQVRDMCRGQLDHLEYKDVCIEGVDFHCSSIVEDVLRDQKFCDLCLDLLQPFGNDDDHDKDNTENSSRSHLESVVKRCIWNFSSGVNRRRSLVDGSFTSSSSSSPYSSFWNELLAPRVAAFQKSYIEQRLV